MKNTKVLVMAVLLLSTLSPQTKAGFEPGFASYRCSLHSTFPGFVRLDVNNHAQCVSILINQFPHLWQAQIDEGHGGVHPTSASTASKSGSKSSTVQTEFDATHCVTLDPTY
jgi:hypothetical protein